ncbi:MAG: rhodanese-like domain-containing protein [Clostridiales bacterium]|nr:rhodanese-like domain-containing protein [Clostridiales bacterium]
MLTDITKRKIIVCIIFLSLCLFCACNHNSLDTPSTLPENGAVAVYHKITAKEAKEVMNRGEPYILLDVRTDEEYSDKRIEGAILIPDFEIGSRAGSELPDKDALILVYCRGGRRSANAANELVSLGYTNVYDIGGINDWPYDTVSK